MFTLKKPLLLIVLLGIISISLCEQERHADEEEESEIKRGLFSKKGGKGGKSWIKGVFKGIKGIGKEVGGDVIRTGIEIAACKIKGEC
uniref:Esculentin-1GN n=1 Tax=Sylvirana guentheri TaxID=110109 RepID=A0A3G6VAR4_SYLGU|nr:esculentin-1GN [Sylvirana guentheri]